MRKDMGKIITEKPRRGSSERNAKTGMSIHWKGHDADYDFDKKSSSSRFRQHGYNAKEFTDVLGPLYRFLDKQVGRPWNKVWAELCEVLDKRKLTHAHVFTHIDSYVERDVYKGVDGLWHTRPYGGLVGGGYSRYQLFVNPKTGLICRQRVKEKTRKQDIDQIKVDADTEYRRFEGFWYICSFKEILVDAWDPILKKGYQKWERRQVSKKQMNKKELKDAGLENLVCICDNKKYNPVCPRHKKPKEERYGRRII